MIDMLAMVEDEVNRLLNEEGSINRMQIMDSLLRSFAVVRKRQLPDLDAKVAEMELKIRDLSQCIRFKANLKDSTVVITASGESDSVLLQLTFGSMWFDGHDISGDILKTMANASS